MTSLGSCVGVFLLATKMSAPTQSCFGCGNKTVKGGRRILWTERLCQSISVRRPWLYSKFVGVHRGTRECCNLIGPFHLACENELVNCMTPDSFPEGLRVWGRDYIIYIHNDTKLIKCNGLICFMHAVHGLPRDYC